MTEENKTIACRFIDEVWNRGKLELIDELLSDDHVDHDPARAGMPGGAASTRAFVETYRAAFPDLCLAIEEVIAERDLVVVRWRATGKQEGPLMGMPPSGRTVSVTGIAIQRITDGKIAESWTNWDGLGMMGQLGISAAPDESAG